MSDDTVTACPHCDSAGIVERKQPEQSKGAWYCQNCFRGFDEPVERAPDFGGNYSAAGRALLDASPEDLVDGTLVADGGRIPADEVHEHIRFWTRITDSRDMQITLHLPAEDCSRSRPRPRCEKQAKRGTWIAEDVAAHPPAHARDHVCELCLSDFNGEPDPRATCEQRTQADVLADLGLTEINTGRIVPDGGQP